MEAKKFWHSKMLWINLLAFLGALISGILGENWLDGEMQVMLLSLVDFILRLKTNKGLIT